VRVTVLLLVLVTVLAWGWRDLRSRRLRNDWDHTLHVAVVMLRVAPVDDRAFDAIRGRGPALEDRLDDEIRRYRLGAPRPFLFTFFGPVNVAAPPPSPEGGGLLDLAAHSWDTWRYVREVDERAGVDAGRFDTRLYVVVRAAAVGGRTWAEGHSEQGGRTGSVEVEMSDNDSADFALIVVAHELLHTLGAEDKYDDHGRTLIPLGLAEPDRNPSLPQRFTEIMARDRPVGPGDERPPDGLDDVAVGPTTAHEIGWTR
jgi:hypothetical protein